MLVDSHCHPHLMDLDRYGGLDAVLANAHEAGVEHLLCVSVDLADAQAIESLLDARAGISWSLGVHPNSKTNDEPDAQRLVTMAAEHRAVAIGETGLDYYRSSGDLEWQRARFRTHIAAAREAGKPLIIHSRDAPDDTLAILEQENAREVGGVMHCFTYDTAVAQRALALDFYISLSGIVTFKNATDLKAVATAVPLDRLLVETDSPYLAPVPYRGKPNQPAYVRHVAEHIAELRGVPVEEIEAATTQNFFTLFPGAQAQDRSRS